MVFYVLWLSLQILENLLNMEVAIFIKFLICVKNQKLLKLQALVSRTYMSNQHKKIFTTILGSFIVEVKDPTPSVSDYIVRINEILGDSNCTCVIPNERRLTFRLSRPVDEVLDFKRLQGQVVHRRLSPSVLPVTTCKVCSLSLSLFAQEGYLKPSR